MILGIIGFALALVSGGQVFAALGPNDISMGTFAIPLPGCAPEVTIGDKDTSTGCYTMTIQSKTLQNGVCSSSEISPTTKQVCDGKDGVGGEGCSSKTNVTGPDSNGCYTVTFQKMKVENEECVEDGEPLTYTTCDGATEVVDERYVPYPQSMTYDTGNDVQIGHEGYRRLEIKFKGDENSRVLKFPDLCEEGEDVEGQRIKTCIAQGNATSYPNADGSHSLYLTDDKYAFVIGESESGFPRYEYTAPRSVSGSVVAKGFTQKVYAYTDGRRVTETGATDECKEYAKPNDRSARVTKCTVQSYQYPSNLLSTWVPGTTEYCLGNHQSDCSQYTLLVGAVDACAGLTSSDDAWETRVVHSESEYVEHVYNTGCTTNCTGTVGYKLIKEEMCNGDVNESTNLDPCEYATLPVGVTCGSGYAYQSCTPQVTASGSTASAYYGCFPDNWSDFAHKNDIVPANFASDGTNLYWCQIQDCENTSACWIGVNKANGPNPSGQSDGTNCWGVVSIDGLQGDAGPGCSFAYYNDKWQVCCLPVDSSGNINVNGQWDCKEVTDSSILNQLNNWMCKPTYTTKYINKKSDGTYEYKPTDTNNRTAATVGVRTTITNCDGTNGGDVDVFDGPAGDDYDPCDGLTAGSQAAQTTILNQTKVYRSHQYSNNHYSPARGYYETTVTYCEGSATTYTPADECTPVADARLARSTGQSCADNQVLKRCTPQEGTQTPYFICDTTEVSGYPKKKYFVPTIENGKITKEGYTAWVHKYTSTGTEIEGDLADKDECHTVYKVQHSRSGDNNEILTATTQTTQKCTVQSYTYPNPSSPWTVGATYCKNTNASGSCTGYSDSISDSETSTLKYRAPLLSSSDSGVPVSAGYTYYDVTDGDDVSVREIIGVKDECWPVYRTSSVATTYPEMTWKCEVQYPGDTTSGATYITGYKYCLNITNEVCGNYQTTPPQELDQCNGGTSATAVKKVVSRTYTRTTGSQGALTSVYKMCNDDDHAETTPDECYEIPTPAGETCTNGVWMQCKRQADEGTASATARGTTYGYCATYPQCVGNENSTTIVKKTERAYTAPTKTGTNSYYDTPGKMVTNKIPCSSSASAIVDSSEDDQCEEIPDTGSICPTNKVLKSCKRKGDESATLKAESTYNLCTTGTSIFDSISENDPCGGDTTSDNAKKKVKSIQYEYVTPVSETQSKRVGYSVKTTTMCNPAGNTTEYIYDTCEPLAASDNCKNGTTYKPYYKCHKQMYDATSANASNREYNACDPLSAAVALSSAVANKLDSDVTFSTGTYENKDYILMSAGGVTNKPVVAVDTLKPQSLFSIWKEQYKELSSTKCQALFGKSDCETGLNETDMLGNINAYGVWKTDQVVNKDNTTATDLTFDKYQESLQPCQGGISITADGQDENGGNKYKMTCTE